MRKKNRWDLILIASEPPFIDMVAGLVCLLRQQAFVILFQDLYPEFAQGARLQPIALFAEHLKKIHSFVVNRARDLIAISQDHQDLLASRYVQRTVMIPNWCPSHMARQEPRSMPETNDRLVVQYAGNLGLACDLRAFEVALRALEATGYLGCFEIVLRGDGIKQQQAEKMAQRFQAVRYEPRVIESEVASKMAQCHAHLILMPATLKGCVYPSKMNSIMAAGRPVIASIPKDSSLSSFIVSHGIGYVSPAEDPSQLAATMMKCLTDLRDNPTILQEMGARGRKYISHEWTRNKATDLYRKVLTEASYAAQKPNTGS